MTMLHHRASARLLLPLAAITLWLASIGCERISHATRLLGKTTAQPTVATKASGSASPAALNNPGTSPWAKNVHDRAASAIQTALAEPRGSEEWLALGKNRLIPVVSDLERHLTRAQNAFDAHDNRLLASELRAAARIVQPANGIPLNEAPRPDLVSAAKNLNQLATQAESAVPSAELLAMNVAGAYDASMQAGLPSMRADQWRAIDHYPLIHLAAARSALPKDAKLAALELRKAESYMNIDAARANGAARKSLRAEIDELSTLADKIGAGKAKEPSEIDRANLHASQALAELYYQNAKDAWQKHDAVGSAQWLTESVCDLREALKSAGVTMDSNATRILAAAEKFAASIQNNAQVDANQMDRQIDQTGVELRRLVALAKITPEKSARMATLTPQTGAQSHVSPHN